MDLTAPPPNGTSQCPFTAALPSVSLSSNVPFQSPRIRSQPVSPLGRAVPSPSGSGPQSTPSKWHLHSPFVLSVSSWTAFPRSGSGTRSRAVTSPPPWQRPFPAALHSGPSNGVSPLGQCCFLLVAGELSVPSPFPGVGTSQLPFPIFPLGQCPLSVAVELRIPSPFRVVALPSVSSHCPPLKSLRSLLSRCISNKTLSPSPTNIQLTLSSSSTRL